MSKRIAAVVVLAGLACLWGVIAFTGQGHEQGTHRFVVENEYDEPRTVTVTIDTPSGRLLTDNTTVMPGEQWVVASVDTSELTDGYTMTVAGEHSSRHQQSRAGPGATLIEMEVGVPRRAGTPRPVTGSTPSQHPLGEESRPVHHSLFSIHTESTSTPFVVVVVTRRSRS